MKTLTFRLCVIALMLIALVIGCVACNRNNPAGTETDGDTSVEVTVDDATEEPTDPATEAPTDPVTAEETTEEETTTEEVTTLRELTWETYDPALDDSRIDPDIIPTVKPSTWVATDGLDRVLPTNTDTGNIREDRTVACFYWTWHGNFAGSNSAFNNQQNIDRLLELGYTEEDYWKMSTTELRKLGVYTQTGPYHFWDEPVYGYYDGDDEWVIRKQAELLASAGVDVVFFDNTNGTFTWLETAKKVMKVFSEARLQGVAAPYVSFMLPFAANSDAKTQVKELYRYIYSQGLYEDMWYMLDGKPMLMAHGNCLDTSKADEKEMKEFFTWRANMAGYLDKETAANQWGWLSVFPQAYFHNAAGELEQMTVGVAVNHDYVKHVISGMNQQNVIGRTWTSRGYDSRENAVYYGACFAQQWEQAIAVDPKIVFVTGWNEWVAMKISYWAAGYNNVFVDQYKDEYSRDCEPSNGPLKDYYYMQLVSYIRQYKGTEAIEQATWEKLIDVNGGFGQWANVGPTYVDYVGLPDRDFNGYRDPQTGAPLHYTNTTGRNDIYDCKVARDYENIYFMVRTVDELTPCTDPDWMHLYISVGESEKNWEHYEYVINKTTPDADYAYVEQFTGNGYESVVVGKVKYKVTGNVLVIEVPKKLLGIAPEQLDFTFDFKWTDNTGVDGNENLEDEGNIMLWYTNGDCAPVSRFNYRYTTTAPEAHENTEKNVGWSLMDFTSDEIKADFDEYIAGDKRGVDAALTDAGLTLTVTISGSDSRFDIDYTDGLVHFLTDSYKYVQVTYTTKDVSKITVSAAGGKQTKPSITRGTAFNLITDGEEHTVVLDLSGKRTWTGGYVTDVCIYFDSADAVGSTLHIKSIQLLKEAPETN